MKKTFREQMLAVIQDRYKEPDQVKRYLAEVNNPAAETLITYIRQWPSLHKSRNQALTRLLECDRWNDKGELVLERNHKGKVYPNRLPLDIAYDWYRYGDQTKQVFPMYSFPKAVDRIPKKIQKDWEAEIKELFADINTMSVNAFKLVALGTWVKRYGLTNPHAMAGWDRNVSEFQDAQKAIDAFVVTRKGWEHYRTENMQNPSHKEGLSKVLQDILVKAGEAVEPAIKAITEQDRRMNIRQDAHRAKSQVKSLSKFFASYKQPVPNALELLEGIISDVENQTLTSV